MSYWSEPQHRRARKRHCCSTCLRRIDPGEMYDTSRGFDSGEVWTFKQCAHCNAVTRIYALLDYDDRISYDRFDGWLRHNAPGVHTFVPGSPHDPSQPGPASPNSDNEGAS